MKPTYKMIVMMICFSVIALIAAACNAPKTAPTPTAVPVSNIEEQQNIENSNGNESVPENSTDGNNEEIPMITNPGRSAVDYPKTASLNFRKPSAALNTAQQTAADDDLVIKNNHTITYPEQQSIIQKSVPSGQLAPLSYIPPSTLQTGQSIYFAQGATSAVISGYVPAGGVVSYNFYAFANQNFLVLLSSDSGTSVLSVSDVYGNVFLDSTQRMNSYSMYLPRTATYYVNIHSQGYAENFTIQIFIPARVTIPAGSTATSMSGTLAPYSVVSYTAYMFAGQTARIDDYSGPQPNSFLRISGLQTGLVYMDYTAYSPSWYAVVPATQDYLIEVISMDQPSNYRLTVDVR
ncbi:MAG: hypothetical protein II969_07825 [Anaerolineaceae bacterium]|nr:hypothetical protein [Anaerolineaceae bacterium]